MKVDGNHAQGRRRADGHAGCGEPLRGARQPLDAAAATSILHSAVSKRDSALSCGGHGRAGRPLCCKAGRHCTRTSSLRGSALLGQGGGGAPLSDAKHRVARSVARRRALRWGALSAGSTPSLLLLAISSTARLALAIEAPSQLEGELAEVRAAGHVAAGLTGGVLRHEGAVRVELNDSHAPGGHTQIAGHSLKASAASAQGDRGMQALLRTLAEDVAEGQSANRDAAARLQQLQHADAATKDASASLSGAEGAVLPKSWARAQRQLLDSNNDGDGWPVDPTLPPELQRPFDGDYVGDGRTWGDQYTGGLMDWSVGGDVYAWGLNNFGQLGTGDTNPVHMPLLVPVLRRKNITRVSAGSEHSVAFSKEGFVWSWGRNQNGQLGLSDSTLSHCDTKSLQSNCNGPRPSQMLFPNSLSDLWGEHVVDISSMWDHNLAVTRSGWTYAWGRNAHGQLGTGDTRDQNIPTKVKNSQAYRFVVARTGGTHSMGLTLLGEVYVWGSGASGQLGQDIDGLGQRSAGPRLSFEPILVEALKGKMVIQIATGWSHCMALTADGEAWMWGGNEHGQLGLGDRQDRFGPVKIQESISGRGDHIGACVSIAGGHGHTLWLNASGLVFSAGRNDAGQLGLADSIDREHVSMVDIPDRIWCDTPFGSEVGGTFADVVCVNSKVRSRCGQRCVGIPTRRDCGPKNASRGLQEGDCEPLMPLDNTGMEVHAGEYTSFVISRDKNVFGWGANTYGQVGIAPELWGSMVRKPRLVISMYGKNISAIEAGREHTVARSDREPFEITSFSPESGPVNGNTAVYIIGQGFNTFIGDLECRFAFYSNGTHTSQYAGTGIVNETLLVLTVKAERYSNMRLRCMTPDVRFRDEDGDVDIDKMAKFLRTLESPRNVTIWWRSKYQLKLPRTFVWNYVALPGITDMIPKAGPVTGGTYLLVSGYGFDPTLSTDVRIRFGTVGNNWMRGCILSDKLIATVTPPSGPSDNGIMDYDGACNNLCPTGFEDKCSCSGPSDFSPGCIRGTVRASLDPNNRASRRDRCRECEYVVGSILVYVSLNGADYGDIGFPFLYYENPTISHLSAPVYTVGHISGARERKELSYGGPEEGGTTVDFHGVGFKAVGLGQALCSWGCSYADQGNNNGPRCDSGSARHSLKLTGQFKAPKVFQFDQPYPLKVWDLIHFGTWFKCDGVYGLRGCPSYDRATGLYFFWPAYDEAYTPTFRGYNETTTVVTSCIEECESRAEFVSDTMIRCVAPPRLTNSGSGVASAENRTLNVTVRLKINGQDIFPDCTGQDCAKMHVDAAHYVYYRQPRVTSITPNGGPLMDESFVYVYGSGFKSFNWFPLCQFGRQTVVVNQNSTTFPGWLSHKYHTNTSAWVVNDTLLLCFAPPLPPNVPQMVDTEMDEIKRAEIAQITKELEEAKLAFLKLPSPLLQEQMDEVQARLEKATKAWEIGSLAIHPDIIGKAFPGQDGLLSTYDDNMIYANSGYGKGTIAVPFTVTFNGQDFLDGSHSHWPFNSPPMSRLSSLNQKFVYYPHPILLSSFPLGGPVIGLTQLIVKGVGFYHYNEMSPWIGQYDQPTIGYDCVKILVELPYSQQMFTTALQHTFKVAITQAAGCWDGVIQTWTYFKTPHIKCEDNAMSADNLAITSIVPIIFNNTQAVSVDVSIVVDSREAGDKLSKSGRLSKDIIDGRLVAQGMRKIVRIVVGAETPVESTSANSSISSTPAPSGGSLGVAQCFRNFSNEGAKNDNWFNNTQIERAPPWIAANSTLGWPQNDRNVGHKYAANRTTSIKCRFGEDKTVAYTLETTSIFWGYLKRVEFEWIHSVYADYLDGGELRCQAPAHVDGFADIEISLNSREYTSQAKLQYIYYDAPTVKTIKPSGGPIEGNTMITITGTNLEKYDGMVRCRFGDESFYDEYYDINLPISKSVSYATAVSSTTMICRAPPRLWSGPINVPFALTLNGQDYNMDMGMCHALSNFSTVMWDNPADAKALIPGLIPYLEMQTRIATLINGCPYVYYPHPISHTLVPAGGPISGLTSVRIFGRGFKIFGEDVRCKFGLDTDAWVQGSDKPVGQIGRDDEILCYSPPHLVLTVGGPEVACTYACIQFPDDSQRCNQTSCSFNTSARVHALKQAVAEIVSVKDIFGDNDVFPEDVTVEFFRQPRIPHTTVLQPSIDVGFCVHCVKGKVWESNVLDSRKIIKAVRNGYMLELLRERFNFPGISFIEVNGDPVQVAVTFNGQDYTYRTNDIFSYYLSPTIIALAPAGGPLIRYAIADADHRRPTTVEISGTGFFNYDEKPQCRFGEEMVSATAFGDRLLKCETPWPRVTFPDDCVDCVLDVWIEVALNGQDFTFDSKVNFRYYLQPEFSTFSPMGGPVEGGTPVTFRGAGFNRFNDGSLRILWGVVRIFAEENIGRTELEDDFDPDPEEVEPLTSQYGTQLGGGRNVIADSYEKAFDIILDAYAFDRQQWDYGSAVVSNSQCSAMDLAATRSKIDVGYLPGDTGVQRQPVTSRSLYLSGTSKGKLSGRYLISKAVDVSRGFGLAAWIRHGNSSSPSPCERPEARDELSFFYMQELGNLYFNLNCTERCKSPVQIEFELCYGTFVSNLSTPVGYEVNLTRLYQETGKVTRYVEYVVPRCFAAVKFMANSTDQANLPMTDVTDVDWVRVSVYEDSGMKTAISKRHIMVPLQDFTHPTVGKDSGNAKTFQFQQCKCQTVYDCATPPCPDYCRCYFVNNTSMLLKEMEQSRYMPTESNARHIEFKLPVPGTDKLMTVNLTVEYIPAFTPPDWKDVGKWKRLSVFGHREYPGYTYLSRTILQNERGRRFGINNNELTESQATEAMIRCPRQKSCYNRKARLMVKQPLHGQGDFDTWALDDVTLNSAGGIISDTEIIARSPPAGLALPLTEAQSLAWKKAGKLTNRYTRGIQIGISMNNQTYEQAGIKNFCRFPGDKKSDPKDPTNSYKDIVCERTTFNWDEPDWPFKVIVAEKYTNWYEGKPLNNWGSNTLFRSSVSEQFLYYQHPKIMAVRPSGGPTAGGTPVTVQGSGFAAFSDPLRTPKCKFGTTVSAAQVVEDDSILCSTPATLYSGFVDMTLSLNEVDFTSPVMGKEYSVPFLYYEHPLVVSITPDTGPARGGTDINIVGTGFFQLPSPPACRFIGVLDPTIVADSPGIFVNDTLIRCRTPSIANLCTRSTHCNEGIGSRDPGWRDCPKWDTCPFTNQCVTCGCPQSQLCKSFEVSPKFQDDPGVKVTRPQISEDLIFDTEVQIALNGICCLRKDNGILTNPCEPCEAPNQRCGCVGDFTRAQYDEQNVNQNTFTFHREIELEQEASTTKLHWWNGKWSGKNTPGPIGFYGQYFRNTSLDTCAFQLKCHDVSECSNAPEAAVGITYGSAYHMRSSLVMCQPPLFPGQYNNKDGNFEVSFSINGQDTSKWSQDCNLDVCREYLYGLPEHPDIVFRNQIITVTVLSVTIIYLYLYRQRQLKKNAKYVADTGGDWEKPLLRDAVRWQQENQFRNGNQYYSIWNTGEKEMGQLGIGMGLYFQYLRFMVYLFSIMLSLSILPMILNSFGMAYKGIEAPDLAIRCSIGSIGRGILLEYPKLPFPALNILGWELQIETPVLTVLLAFLDITISLVYISGTWYLRVNQTEIIQTLDEDTITAADYTILVEDIPNDATDPDEFRAFFSKYGEVADVAIGLNNGKLIDMFQKRGQHELEIEEQVAKLKLYKLQELQKKLKVMRKQQKKIDEKIIQLRSKSDFKSVCAFVTFNEDKGKIECVSAYESTFIQRMRGKAKATKRFRGTINLKVSIAPEPSNVLWENLQFRGFNTTIRACIVYVIIVVLLLMSFAVNAGLQVLQSNLQGAPGDYLCLVGPQPSSPDAQLTILWSKYSSHDNALYQAYLNCYCNPDKGNMNAVEVEFCEPWRANQQLKSFLSILAVLVVAVVNGGLETVLRELAAFQKPHTISGLETKIASSVFIAQFVNTGILILLYNAKWDGIKTYLFSSGLAKVLEYVSITLGTHVDTDYAWFKAVGTKLFTQCISQSIVPNVSMAVKWPIEVIKQNLLKNRCLTQKLLNKLYEGAEYPLWKRYANMLNIMFVIMTYNSGIPMLNVFGVIYFFMAYWADKIAILRGCKRPPQYDEKLPMAATNYMSIAMGAHLVFATWFFGYPDSDNVVSSTLFAPKGNDINQIIKQSIGSILPMEAERLQNVPAFLLFMGFLLWFAFELIMRAAGPAILAFIRQRLGVAEEEFKEGNPSFFEALENQEISGLDNYNIKKNPRYRDAFSSEIVEVQEDDDEDVGDDDFGQDDDD